MEIYKVLSRFDDNVCVFKTHDIDELIYYMEFDFEMIYGYTVDKNITFRELVDIYEQAFGYKVTQFKEDAQ